jgi:hypothetical protein
MWPVQLQAGELCGVCGPVRKGAHTCTCFGLLDKSCRDCTKCESHQTGLPITRVFMLTRKGDQNKRDHLAQQPCSDCENSWSALYSSKGSYGPGVFNCCGGLGAIISSRIKQAEEGDHQIRVHGIDLADRIISPCTPDRTESTEAPTFNLNSSMEALITQERAGEGERAQGVISRSCRKSGTVGSYTVAWSPFSDKSRAAAKGVGTTGYSNAFKSSELVSCVLCTCSYGSLPDPGSRSSYTAAVIRVS